jgi:hypothetical protein
MKIFFYTGRNPNNKSGVSWKIWKIERKAKTVTTWWWPAEIRNRRVVFAAKHQNKANQFGSVQTALDHERKLIASKVKKGMNDELGGVRLSNL